MDEWILAENLSTTMESHHLLNNIYYLFLHRMPNYLSRKCERIVDIPLPIEYPNP